MSHLGDPRLRFRIWVDATLVDEAWIDVTDPDAERQAIAIRNRHAAIAELAEGEGWLWLIETWDPDHGEFGYQRMGTDTAGMRDPIRVDPR